MRVMDFRSIQVMGGMGFRSIQVMGAMGFRSIQAMQVMDFRSIQAMRVMAPTNPDPHEEKFSWGSPWVGELLVIRTFLVAKKCQQLGSVDLL
jgi:hypothetical protein